MSQTAGHTQQELERENERLRERVAALESELVDTRAKANEAVAKWQERAYWLDRWHLDLNALMRRPGASQVRNVLKGLRAIRRVMVRLKRSLANR
jgi:hypothetical protein